MKKIIIGAAVVIMVLAMTWYVYVNQSPAVEANPLLDTKIAEVTKTIDSTTDSAQKGDALSTRAQAYKSKKQYDLAIQDLTRAMDIDSQNVIRYQYCRGFVYMDAKKFEEAAKDLGKVSDELMKFKTSMERAN